MMLLPSERYEAIRILATHYQTNISNYHAEIYNIMTNGFKGFAQFSDHELMRAMVAASKKYSSYEIQNFVSTIAAEKFILE